MQTQEHQSSTVAQVELEQVPSPATYYAARSLQQHVNTELPVGHLVGQPVGQAVVQASVGQAVGQAPVGQLVEQPDVQAVGQSVGPPVGQSMETAVQMQSNVSLIRGQPPPRQIPVCAYCGGMLRDQYTTLGILLAIVCFPFGLICCIKFRELRCTICGR